MEQGEAPSNTSTIVSIICGNMDCSSNTTSLLHHLLGNWILKLELLHTFGITYKNTPFLLWIKFRYLITRNMHKSRTFKYYEIIKTNRVPFPNFFCNFLIKWCSWWSVEQIPHHIHRFYPKAFRKTSLQPQTLTPFNKGLIHSLCNINLLWCFSWPLCFGKLNSIILS